jgi:hypothetical protein
VPTNSKEYDRKYYAKHRLELRKKRQLKYQTDPEYAQRQRDRSRAYRERMKKKKGKKPRKKTNNPPALRSYNILVGKDKKIKTTMYEIGALASFLDRRSQTLRLWERQEVLPRALYRTKTGRRLYTEDQVNALIEAHNKVMGEVRGVAWLHRLRIAFSQAWRELLPHGLKKERYTENVTREDAPTE